MKPAILGVDAGGTHTRALVRASDGRTGMGEAGPANWTTLGPERCAGAVAEAAGAALHSAGLPAHALTVACVSLAGYYPPWHEAAARAAFGAALPAPALRLVPDLVAAWAGATGGEAGIVLARGDRGGGLRTGCRGPRRPRRRLGPALRGRGRRVLDRLRGAPRRQPGARRTRSGDDTPVGSGQGAAGRGQWAERAVDSAGNVQATGTARR